MRRVVLGCAILVIGVPLLFYAGLVTRRPVAYPASYWIVDDRSIGVMIQSGGGLTCGIASAAETLTEIRLRSECYEPWLSLGGTADLKLTVVLQQLAAPVGSRVVIDGRGTAARQCADEVACQGLPYLPN